MKIYHTYAVIASLGLLGLSGCNSDSADGNYNSPASDELIETQIDSATKASVDSVAQATNEGNIMFPVPDTLTNLLKQYQPQARLANLTDQALSNKTTQTGNPVYLYGNFNGKGSQDYAVQVQQGDSIHILAYLDYRNQPREMKVAAYPATKLNNAWYSTYQLKLAPQDSLVRDNRSRKQVPLQTDGISIMEENRTTLYVLQKGRFIPFDATR